MNEYTKSAIVRGAVVAVAALVVFFAIIVFASAKWWAIPFPAVAIGYGVYNFVKKYYHE